MSSSNCPICKVHEQINTKIERKQTEEEITEMSEVESDSDNEIYETESEHEWDSDEPDDIVESSKEKSTSDDSKDKLVEKDLEDTILEEMKTQDHNVLVEKNLEDNAVEKDAEESHIRVTRGLPKLKKVEMPSGKIVSITTPTTHGWKCGRITKLITLHKHGKLGKREYDTVAKELERTKMSLLFCPFRGGCVKSYRVLKIQKLVNGCLWKKYQNRKHDIDREGPINERMLFHGTRSTRDIVNKGFDERLSSPNGIFGPGVYFAEKSTAANEYTFGMLGGTGCPKHHDKSCTVCVRKMLMCRVALGKIYDTGTPIMGKKFAHAPVGYHSVKGRNGPINSYNEFIVYRGEQAYPEYLISYTINI